MKLRGVEAARGVAAVMVVLLHVTSMLADPKQYGVPVFGGLFQFGRAGVDFFFVLSGFIIAYVHADDIGRPERFWSYWRKRLWRIYPVYLVATLLYQGLLALSPTADRAEQDWMHILASWTLFPEPASPILAVGWSLRHELVFYAVFSLSMLNRTLGRIAIASWGLGIVANLAASAIAGHEVLGGPAAAVIYQLFNIHFFFGMAVAVLVRRSAWRPGLLLGLGTALFLANGLVESFGGFQSGVWLPRQLAYAVGAAMILYGLAALDRQRWSRVPDWAVRLGGASYSIYLMHNLFAVLLVYALRISGAFRVLPIELCFVVVVGAAVIAGVVFSHVVEQPLQRLGRARIPRDSRGPALAADV